MASCGVAGDVDHRYDSLMKRCGDCGLEKSLEEFPYRNKAKATRKSQCKECARCYIRRRRGAVEKTCTKCGETKLESRFPWKHYKKKRAAHCKACQRQVATYWYQHLDEIGKQAHRDRVRRRSKELAEFVQSFKVNPCPDCQRQFSPWQMQFDHRPELVKLHNVCDMVRGGASKKRILAEIEKCDIICASCHADRTYQRRQ